MKLVILASGTGSLAQAIFDEHFEVAAVVTDNPNAEVLDRAIKAGIATKVIEFRTPRNEWDSELNAFVSSIEPDLVVCVGFMRLLSPEFVNHFKVINSHPSLLPNFPGAHAVKDALAAGITETGCSVHWVDAGMDTGEIISQIKVPVEAKDDERSLHERIKIVERKMIVDTLKQLEVM